jgi:hypothetical protein
LLVAAALLGGCHSKSGGELRPPADAEAWDERLGQLFDDRFTPTPIALAGRAPGDVLDQLRFSQRLGYAHLAVLVTVDQVWSRTLLGGQPQQRVEITLGDVLRGELPRSTNKQQQLHLKAAEEMPAAFVGRVVLMFVRWAPGEGPAYHFHLMPADENVIALIEAMVRHARAEGKLDEGKRGRKRRKKNAAADSGQP